MPPVTATRVRPSLLSASPRTCQAERSRQARGGLVSSRRPPLLAPMRSWGLRESGVDDRVLPVSRESRPTGGSVRGAESGAGSRPIQSSRALAAHTSETRLFVFQRAELLPDPERSNDSSMTAQVLSPTRFMPRDQVVVWAATRVAAGAGVCLGSTPRHSGIEGGDSRDGIGGRAMVLDRLGKVGAVLRYSRDDIAQAGGTDPGP